MKKILAIIVGLTILFATTATSYAQVGVKAGLNLTNVKGSIRDDFKGAFKTYTGFHAGITYKMDLPLGLALQPELLYSLDGCRFNAAVTEGNLKVSTIMLPVAVQWGLDLGLARPFVQAVPYLGYAFSHKIQVAGHSIEKISKDVWNSLDYGVGLGLGVDIWKVQVSARYNWGLGSVAAKSDFKDFVPDFKKSKISGMEISVAVFF